MTRSDLEGLAKGIAPVLGKLFKTQEERFTEHLEVRDQRIAELESQVAKLATHSVLRWTGTWTASQKYVSNELVTWDGACWISIRDNSGWQPGSQTDGPWRIFAMRGKTGSAAKCRCGEARQ